MFAKELLSSKSKHILHCCLFLFVVFFFQTKLTHFTNVDIDPWEKYGFFPTCLLYLLKLSAFALLPQVIFNLVGLTYYNAFPKKIPLKASPILLPSICFRVVTKGNFPELVRNKLRRNIDMCRAVGLDNFHFEVVTDKRLGLVRDLRVREIVVPINYSTRSGTLFKGRALQYCLEDEVNQLTDNDWIVHLDEETLLTENSIKGICNFISDGKHQLGQGLITYADEEVINLMTTIADTYRVAIDMGELRIQLKLFNKLLTSWKGSFMVVQYSSERDINFDNGPESSLAEDLFFGLKAARKGYSFDFIEGEMWEKSPFTIWDFIQQRKRWVQGILLVALSKSVPLKQKIFLVGPFYTFFLAFPSAFFTTFFPVPVPPIINFAFQMVASVGFYLSVYGTIKSFSFRRLGLCKSLLCLLGPFIIAPFYLVVQTTAVIWAVLGKRSFGIVDKKIISDIV